MRHLPAFKAAVAAAAGIILGRLLPGYTTVFFSAALVSAIVTTGWMILRKNKAASGAAAGAYLTLLTVFAFYMSISLASLEEVHPGDFRIFAGTVEDVPRDTSRPSVVLTDCFGFDKGWREIDGDLIFTPKRILPLNVGDRIILTGKPGIVSSSKNPGEFNLQTFYRLNGIAGRIYLGKEEDLLSVQHKKGFVFSRDVVEPIRRTIRDETNTFLMGDEAALARAMVLGERFGINKEINEQFINSGTIHILAVSGLHIGFLTGILMTLASFARLARRWRFFVISPILIIYAFVVGLSPSVTRAVIMAIVVLFGLFLQRRSRIVNSLGFAALIILVFAPAQLFSPGFQLSFAAVLSIAVFHDRMLWLIRKSHPVLVSRPLLNSITSALVLTFAATLGTVPLTAYYFDRISLVALLANFFIVPLSGIFMALNFTFLLFGLFSAPLAAAYAGATHMIGFLLLKTNAVFGSLSISTLRIGESAVPFGILYFFWMIAVVRFGGNSLRKKFVFAILLGADLFVFSGFFVNRSAAKLYVLDVGQGDAIYLEFPDGKNMLIDSGARFGRVDAGARIVVPFLKKMGIRELNYFVVTHLHNDHVGGAVSILKAVKVRNFIYPDQISRSATWTATLAAVHALNIQSRNVLAGTVLDSSLISRVYVLHPNRRYVGESGESFRTRYNNGSVVLKVCVGGNSVILAGDIEQPAERGLVEVYGDFLSSDVLKAGHHGSNTSSSQEFLEKVGPEFAVISVGAGNRFGHPSQSVLDRMSLMGIEDWRTDSLGAAYIRLSADGTEFVHWR